MMPFRRVFANRARDDGTGERPPGAGKGLAAAATLLTPNRAPWLLLLLILAFGIGGMPLSTWITLTVAGLGMGLMIFIMATGMTLTFGLMDVLNLGHGALIAIGGFIGATVATGYEFGHWPALPWLQWHPDLGSRIDTGAAAVGALIAALFAAVLLQAARRAGAHSARTGLWLGAAAAGGAVAGVFAGGSVALHAPLVPVLADLGIVVSTFVIASLVLAVLGLAFEFLFIRPVYRDPLRQILITVGASYLIAELLKAIWGPGSVSIGMPSTLVGSFVIDGVVVEKYRLLAAAIGVVVYLALQGIFHRTRVGLLIRAGVENGEMVQALGYRVRLLFIAVFVGGAALAGLGGAMWGLYQGQVSAGMGAELLVLIIIVVVMGGLGSITGCLYASILVGLLSNYTTYIVPTVSLFSSIGLMMIVLLLWPRGLVPVR
jgi:branched-chain amino acid transport system permease protein